MYIMLKRKNILKVILCISLVCLSVSLIFSVNYFINNLDHKNENKIVNDNNVKEQENEIQDNLIVDDNQEETKNDKVDNNQTNIEKENNNNSSNTNSIPKKIAKNKKMRKMMIIK